MPRASLHAQTVLRRRRRVGLSSVLLATVLAGCAATTPAVTPAPVVSATSLAPTAANQTPSPSPSVTTAAPEVDRKAVSKALAKISRAGIKVSGVAVFTETGDKVAGRNSTRPMAPASTMKVLTSLAAADLLGADHRFTTSVVSQSKGKVVLVGGGDPLLTDKQSDAAAKPASLAALAKRTAKRLKADGVKRVSLGYDTSLFSGPSLNSGWDAKWRKFVSRVTALSIGEGLFNPWKADPKPQVSAANAFAKRLRAAGIKVTSVSAATAPTGATQLASVESAPLSTIIERTLRLSDNFAAEVLARHVGVASGAPGSFSGATKSLKEWLVAHQLWESGMKLIDGSGLAKSARVTPSVLAQAVVLALSSADYAAVIDGLPVAGKDGTLKYRFNDKAERIARGNVHAKTGSLTGIGALAGYLTTADGTRLVFAEVANQARGSTTAHNWLDRSAAALVRCHCDQ